MMAVVERGYSTIKSRDMIKRAWEMVVVSGTATMTNRIRRFRSTGERRIDRWTSYGGEQDRHKNYGSSVVKP